MKGNKSQSWNISKGISIYLRRDSSHFYGCLRIDGKYYRKSLNTDDKDLAKELVLEWNTVLKEKLLSEVPKLNS